MQNLKSKYEQKEMKVSDGLWDRLEEKLDQAPTKEKKPKVIWWRFVAVIILIVNFGAISWMTDIKNKVKENPEFEFRTDQISSVRQHSENTDGIQKSIPINNSETNHQKLTITNINSSTSELTKKENQITEKVSEKELIIKKEEPQTISQLEEKLAQNEIQKPREKVKYVSSSDLLFGVEIDKAKTETPKSAMGINTIKLKNDSDLPNPKRIKLFGITLYDKDSITTK
ncbi:hypothetical protein EIB75_10215 [Epilithonimonas vandammei]|uniref:Uncharacterized protein n=2 Tax=Epilithonimonas TaxID=2782229 RepID=A0A3G8ZEU2_9FLAO|nr:MULTISPECIES: hypothetical protein [Epilithonimonas]AZI55600.1 hypothetical protein EIB75_10215 [Epilithonimonas vandammei]REC72689.1 hypothetical protein DRF58_01515 [Epilithonimonas hispanica]